MDKKTKKFIIESAIYLIIISSLIIGIPRALSHFLGTSFPMATITSESMWPVLNRSDMVFIKKVDKQELKVGDIIVFNNEKGFTIHRIINLGSDTITTKGDANNIADDPIKYDEVVGRTVNWGDKPLKIPYIGMITIWTSQIKPIS